MINTVIIDAKKQDRDRIVTMLQPEDTIKILAYGKDGYDALKIVGSLKPDIAIMDNHLEFIEGEEIPPLLKVRSPSTLVVIFTSKISDSQLYKAVSNEVSGIAHKETDMDILPGILKSVSRGEGFISPVFAARMLRLFSIHNAKKTRGAAEIIQKDDPTRYLSKMELRILTSMGEGFTNSEIAKQLGLAAGTVRNYTSAVMHKTGQRSRAQMVRYAFNHGLVPLERKKYNERII